MSRTNSMHRQSGLTLVELMVASTLSMVLLAGVLVLFSANKATYRLQEGLSAIQDSGRYAVSQIKRDIEVAGFGGCITEDLAAANPAMIAASPPQYVDDYQIGIRVSGQNDVSSSVDVDGEDVIDGTDILQIRGPLTGELFYANGPTFPNNAVVVRRDAGALGSGDFALITDCSGADIFEISGAVSFTSGSNTSSIPHAASVNNTGQLSRRFGADSVVMSLVTRTYFIGTSAGTDRAGNPILALFVSDGVTPQEILQGVEDMQITYATDENDDGNVDYVPANSVTDWAAVLGVRISLLANSIEQSAQAPASYVYLPSGSTAITPTDPNDRLMRQEFAIVATLRNNVK